MRSVPRPRVAMACRAMWLSCGLASARAMPLRGMGCYHAARCIGTLALLGRGKLMAQNAGVVLAGGRSSRMGENKADMRIRGEPLVARAVRQIAPVVNETLVIGPRSLQALVPHAHVIGDAVSGMGPLGGLYTALTTTSCRNLFLMACDMPFVQPGLVQAMLALSQSHESADVVILPPTGRTQPLHAVYRLDCLPAVERALASDDHSLHRLLSHLSVVTLDAATVAREDPRSISAFNVNTPADWALALRIAGIEDP